MQWVLSRANNSKAGKLKEHSRLPQFSGDHFLCCTYVAHSCIRICLLFSPNFCSRLGLPLTHRHQGPHLACAKMESSAPNTHNTFRTALTRQSPWNTTVSWNDSKFLFSQARCHFLKDIRTKPNSFQWACSGILPQYGLPGNHIYVAT